MSVKLPNPILLTMVLIWSLLLLSTPRYKMYGLVVLILLLVLLVVIHIRLQR